MQIPFRWLLSLTALICLPLGSAQAAVLYDGSLGTVPSAQGWIYLTNPLSGSLAVQSLAPSAVQVDTTAREDDQAGYFASLHPSLPLFDREAGFTVRADVQILSEAHSTIHRAGFSIVALSLDLKGVELSFWANEVWAQTSTPLFHHGEGAAYDTTSHLARYELTIHGDNYSVTVDGTPLLGGAVRDYTEFGLPYTVPNFLFAGDDTSSARAKFRLGRVEALGLAAPLVGDANGDCSVGAADYALWAAQFGQTGAGLSADFDGSASVGTGDYALWAANFGNTCPAGVANVPEPSGGALAVGALLLSGLWRARRVRVLAPHH